MAEKVFSIPNLNPNLVACEYAVRGKLPIRAGEIQADIRKGTAYPFKEVIWCNIGNPQQLNQRPLTFFRQVLSLIEYPPLIDVVKDIWPSDVIERAKRLHAACGCYGATGAYSHSKGHLEYRKSVAEFIKQRDGTPCDPESVYLTDGASTGIKLALSLLIKDHKSGIMTPIPQYPLYSASIVGFGGRLCPYYLTEAENWGLKTADLEKSYSDALKEGIDVKALVVINPGNPSGSVLTRENIDNIIRFAAAHRVCILADEVYQENIYGSVPFVSFRKALLDMPQEIREKVELISYHSTSKGFIGECGKRGGYFQLEGISPEANAQMYKLSSVNLCSNIIGQVLVEMMVNPPKQGEPSFELYNKEKMAILDSLKRRARRLNEIFNTCEGITCVEPTGALYAYPQLKLPKKFLEEQKEKPDEVYCMRMLEETGICVVPGCGFGQAPGTYHFRMAFLPPEDQIEEVANRFKKYHASFMEKYRN